MSADPTGPNADPRPPTYRPDEFYPIFSRLPKAGDAVICGGQAVNLLAAIFLTPEELDEVLGEGGSATSTDMDIIITKELQQKIECSADLKAREFTIKRFPDARQPISFAIIPDDMPETRIDVLRAIKGVHIEKDRVYEDALEIDAPYKVMNPVTLMIAKAENCASLDQSSPSGIRNDITHLKMLIPIVKNYLNESIEHCEPKSKQEQRVIINHLKKLQKAAGTSGFIKGFETAGVRLRDAIPRKTIAESQLDALKSFFETTFLPGLTGRKAGKTEFPRPGDIGEPT